MLEVNFAGLRMKNPVIVASATPSITVRNLERAAQAGAGAVVLKSAVLPTPESKPSGYPAPRPTFAIINKGIEFDRRMADSGAMFTLFRAGEPYPTPDEQAEMIRQGKERVDIPIIGSICGPPKDYEKWQQLAVIIQQAGADAIELNMHCVPTIKYTDPEIVATVRKVVKVPLICKLMTAWEDPLAIGPQIVAAGADAITAMGTFQMNAIELDIETGQFLMQPSPYGMGGAWLRPVALAWILRLSSCVDVPLSGVSGVTGWQDCIKYIMLGATTVQTCGALYAGGYKAIGGMLKGMSDFMERKGYSNLAEIRGSMKAQARVTDPALRAKVDRDKCTNCGDCVETCFYEAIGSKADQAEVVPDKCEGCGLCICICQQKALSLERAVTS